MERIFKIGDLCFSLCGLEQIVVPKSFLLFETTDEKPEYHYGVLIKEILPIPIGKLNAQRVDFAAFSKDGLESRLIGVKGAEQYYACYEELTADSARVTLQSDSAFDSSVDPMFSSLLALERRMLDRDGLVFHCSHLRHNGEAILFSGPSGIGKSTQADLWVKYQSSEVINGDRALLTKTDGRWTANGWPVSGTSGICKNSATPIKAIVMLEQSKTNRVRRVRGLEAVRLLYEQTTVNSWNISAVEKSMDLLESLLDDIPVYCLECDISEDAVTCLKNALYD